MPAPLQPDDVPAANRRPRLVRLRVVGTVLGLALTASACRWVPTPTFHATSTPAFSQRYLTRDGTDGYATAAGPGTVKSRVPFRSCLISERWLKPIASLSFGAIWAPTM